MTSERRDDALRIGAKIAPVSIHLTFQRMVMIASANRDFAPIHIDREYARRSGADDAYTNMMFVMGLMQRTVESWLPGARLTALKQLRMTAFNRVDDVVTCRGVVHAVDAGGEVAAELWLETSPERKTAVATASISVRDVAD